MRTIIFTCFCMLSCLALTITGCKDESDTQKPVINLIEPVEGDVIKIGSEHGVHFEAEFSDNEALASYKISVHPNFDGHQHAILRSGAVDFEFDKSWLLYDDDNPEPKNVSVHHHDIKVPEDATPGAYHLMVYCTDKAGNQSYLALNVVLSHEGDDDDGHDDED